MKIAKKFVAVILVLYTCLFAFACTDENDGVTVEVSLSITCANVFLPENAGLLDENIAAILPPDGVIFPLASVAARDKQTVYSLVLAVTRENKIHCEASKGYIKAVCNLYEKACGEESGWVFLINGEFSSAGANSVYVRDGDKIEWIYSVKRGDISVG